VLAAPNGVVSHVYPYANNKAVIGLDFFSSGDGNQEALLAKDAGRLVLGGPFKAVQGGQVLVGRLPVFLDGPDEEKIFWGMVSTTLRYPQALAGAALHEIQQLGFEYEVWRLNPDSGDRQIIASSRSDSVNASNYVEKKIQFLPAVWYFRILQVRPWYTVPELWVLAAFSLILSSLLASLTQSNYELKKVKDKLETLSNSDPLTGIFNRRYFMRFAAEQMTRSKRLGSESFIIMLDIDNFKSVNDKHGHQTGDFVLQEAVARASIVLRSYDIIARYGGEEFVIFVSEINQESVVALAERIRLSIAETEIVVQDLRLSVSASLGIGPATPVNDLETAIAVADSAMYQAKREGRNRVCYSNT